MKPLVKAVSGLVLAIPVLSFAQTGDQSLTRAQVRADLVRAENAGYSPTAWADFPDGEIQAAEFRVAARKAMKGRADEAGRNRTP
ncbi:MULTISPECIES: DUF4148 domain-containing protein [unclassified Caballeronia]|uniref:DUF4148 domain-containing protein n=1 Tax=unclassified Caballeronia TaxID=2646786 RepID=UPI00202805E3|nr:MULTISPECIES: DUF4148 domain-containing protein [unclassified Caballeronia]MDR5795095.1 DUF4148 domain-containing protein [Caballeronia sp. LZ008]